MSKIAREASFELVSLDLGEAELFTGVS